MADSTIVEVPAVTVRPDPGSERGITEPPARRTEPVGLGVSLDQIYAHERKRADEAERNSQMIGDYTNDPLIRITRKAIEATTTAVSQAQALVQPGLEKAGETIAKDVGPIVGDPRFEAVGAGVTTGGVLTGNPAAAVSGLGMLGMAKVGKGLFRSRFNTEPIDVEKLYREALQPSPLADRITTEINKRTGVVTDEEAIAQSKRLVEAGGVTPETLARYLPETADMNAAKILAGQQIVTKQADVFLDIAKDALNTGDEVLADQALNLYYQIIDLVAGYAGVVTNTAHILRLASSEDMKRWNLLAERASKTSAGMSAIDKLRYMLADPSVDPTAQGKGVTAAFKGVIGQAKEIAAQGNEAQAQLFLHEIEQAINEEVQQTLFPTAKDVKAAQKIYKNVTAQHIVEANKAAAAQAEKDTFKLTPTGPAQPKMPQTNYIQDQEKAHLATIKEHQAQDMRLSQGTSVFSPKREVFKLTPPPGGARRPPVPKQLDLLTLIAKEPEPEQLALEMSTSVERPEMSREFLSLIKKTQKAIDSGNAKDVGETLAKLQKILVPRPKPNEVAVPKRTTALEKKILAQVVGKAKEKGLTGVELLQAIVNDPSMQPDALVAAAVNLRNPTWRDAWQHLVINSLLTPSSDFVNFVSTGMNLGMHIGGRTMAGVSGQVARVLGGKQGVLLGEEQAMLHGLYSSFWDSVKLAGRVLKTHKPELGPAALREEALRDNPLTASAMFSYSPTARRLAGIDKALVYDSASYPVLSRAGIVSHAINFFGTAAGLPGRLMLTGDQFMQSMAMNAEMHALAYRQAGQQAVANGYSELEFYKAVKPLFKKVQQDMPDYLRKAGEEFALDAVLLKELGGFGTSVMALREQANKLTGIGGTIALPFLKTLVNNAKATWEFSPLAPLSNAMGAYGRTHEGTLAAVAQKYRDDMFGTDPVKRDVAIGKWAFGSMVTSSMLWAAFEGRLTGRGPDNPNLRKAGYEAYGLPDSFIYNTDTGERVQIKRLGALANIAGMAADAAEIWGLADEQTKSDIAQLLTAAYVSSIDTGGRGDAVRGAGAIAKGLTTAVASNLDMDFMLNSVHVAEALINGGKNEKDLATLAASVTAGMLPLAGTARAVETAVSEPRTVKDARDILDKILARFPGYDWAAKKYNLPRIPIERNLFGEPVKRDRAWFGTEWFNPLLVSAPNSKDALMRDFAEILANLKMDIAKPAMVTGKNNLPLTKEEYDHYEELAGQMLRERILGVIDQLKSPQELDQVKRDLITNEVTASRRQAARQLLGDIPELADTLAEDTIYRYTVPRTPRRTLRVAPPSIGP